MSNGLTVIECGTLDKRGARFNCRDRAEWVQAGQQLSAMHDSVRFWLADWFCHGQDQEYFETHQQLEMLGLELDVHQIKIYATVGKQIPAAKRKAGLSFNHHKAIADCGEPEAKQAELLEAAVLEKLTVPQLRRRIAKAYDDPDPRPSETIWAFDRMKALKDLAKFYGMQDFNAWTDEDLDLERVALKALVPVMKKLGVV